MTYKDIIKMTLEEGYLGVDNTCNGKCSKCGECCGAILPLDQEDVDKIENYVLENNIHSISASLILQNKLQCPYYTGNKEKGCAIYLARPKVCKLYKCDKKGFTLEEIMIMKNAIPIYMWKLAKKLDGNIEKRERKKKVEKKYKREQNNEDDR